MTDDNPYGFDPKTGTVRVGVHDLARLLLQLREEMGRGDRRRPWHHMADWDKSFERLADAVDYGGSRSFNWSRDLRMRCDLSETYQWPEGAPYDGGPVEAVTVKGYGSHYVPRSGRQHPRALCGLMFAPEEGKRNTTAPTCPVCVREREFAAALKDERAQLDA